MGSGTPAFPNTTSSSATPSCHRQLLCGVLGRGRRDRTPGIPGPLPRLPGRRRASCSSALFVCRGLHPQIELRVFLHPPPFPSLFSAVPKFTPSATSASAPPLLGTAFCLSGSPGSMGVCDDNNTRAYITLFISRSTSQTVPNECSGRTGDQAALAANRPAQGQARTAGRVRGQGSGDKEP